MRTHGGGRARGGGSLPGSDEFKRIVWLASIVPGYSRLLGGSSSTGICKPPCVGTSPPWRRSAPFRARFSTIG
jgi:hypothetical protein